VTVRRSNLLWLAVLSLVAGACSDSGPAAAPTTTAAPDTTVAPTTSTMAPATTTTSTTLRPTTTVTTVLALGPGEASIVGTVLGPTGPIDGATVRVERLVGKAIATTDVVTAGGGAWQLGAILGGSYRVRAFRAPDFGQSAVESFFLAADERRNLDLRVPILSGERIFAVVNPNPPRVDQPATVTVQIGSGRVDDEGRPTITPRVGVVLALVPGPGILLESSPQVASDGNGNGSWRIRCAAEGADSVSLTVNAGVTNFKLPPCGPPPAPTPAATTTTRPR
jgi:hypothetical protein